MDAKQDHSAELQLLPQLTDKQREVMRLVADNRTSKEIAGLLGISESAVNQRIEAIRQRLGGIPRGELARLYRQEFSRINAISATYPPGWKKIQVPEADQLGNSDGREGIRAGAADRSQYVQAPRGDGSQLSLPSSPGEPQRLTRDSTFASLVPSLAIATIILVGIGIATMVTILLG